MSQIEAGRLVALLFQGALSSVHCTPQLATLLDHNRPGAGSITQLTSFSTASGSMPQVGLVIRLIQSKSVRTFPAALNTCGLQDSVSSIKSLSRALLLSVLIVVHAGIAGGGPFFFFSSQIYFGNISPVRKAGPVLCPGFI